MVLTTRWYLLLWPVGGQWAVDSGQDEHQPRNGGLTIGLQAPWGAGDVAHIIAMPSGRAVKVDVQGWIETV